MPSDQFYNLLDTEDKHFYSRIKDMVNICGNKSINKFSFFLDERQCALAKEILCSLKYNYFIFFGGYEDAKRKILCIFSKYNKVSEKDFPMTPIEFSYRKADKLYHKDFLGALMSVGINRDILGDIIVNEGSSVIFIYNTAVDVIFNDVDKIGRVGVKKSIFRDKVPESENKYKEISGTVSSLRLDCLVSLAIKNSREKSSQFIKAIGVEVNYKKISAPDFIINEGDVFSLRGQGKFILYKVGGLSKKQRYYITIRKLI